MSYRQNQSLFFSSGIVTEMGWVGEHIFKDTWAIPIKIGGQEGVGAYFSNPEYKGDRSSING